MANPMSEREIEMRSNPYIVRLIVPSAYRLDYGWKTLHQRFATEAEARAFFNLPRHFGYQAKKATLEHLTFDHPADSYGRTLRSEILETRVAKRAQKAA